MKVQELLLEVKCIGIGTSIGISISDIGPVITLYKSKFKNLQYCIPLVKKKEDLCFPDINTFDQLQARSTGHE